MTTLRGRLQQGVSLAPLTTWKVGGPAERLYEPADREDLIAFLRDLPEEEPLLWLGLGSNLLIRDGGVRGTVIRVQGALDTIDVADDGASLVAEAGVHCARLAKVARDRCLAGLGFMAGIPGTVGGALAMNAGAWGGETWQQVMAAECVLPGGETRWIAAHEVDYGYRHVRLPARVLGFLAAQFKVSPDTDGEDARRSRESLARRKATQPVGRPSAGSTFRNPPGDYAARLIESCGLKGYQIGGAQVSTLHANFLLTVPGARAADVEALIAHIEATVADRTGVHLQTEVRIVGDAA